MLKENKVENKTFYATFGCGQPHAKCYIKVYAENEEEAREWMFRQFGDKWSMMYKSAEEAGIEKWNLREIK